MAINMFLASKVINLLLLRLQLKSGDMIHLIIVEIEGDRDEQIEYIAITLSINDQDRHASGRDQDHTWPRPSFKVPPDDHLVIIDHGVLHIVPEDGISDFRRPLLIHKLR